MEINKRLTTVGYTERHLGFVEEFCKECRSAGYKNNESIEAMKLEWCLSLDGQFFLTYLNDRIISLSGCHPLKEVGENVYRILFRGATLPEYQNLHGTLSKTHMNSIPFYYHIPRQINWATIAGYTTYAVTTNHNNKDGIESMNKSHRVFNLLEKQNIVTCLHKNLWLFNNQQSVWSLNVDNYFISRNNFKERNGYNV
jgi:hypothetical protein